MIRWRLFEAGHCRHPEIATRRDGALGACEFPSLAALLQHPRQGWMLFDTGYAAHFLTATQAFPERLYRWVTPVHLQPHEPLVEQLRVAGIGPDDIRWVVLSHLHGDHVAGIADFPRARIALSQAAWDDLRGRNRWSATRQGFLPRLLEGATPRMDWFEQRPACSLPAALQAFGQGYDLLGDGRLLLVPLPGHAPGHFGLWFEDAQGPVFLIGDAAWSSDALVDAAPPPRLVSSWLGDTPRYLETLAHLRELRRAHPRLRIVPSHCRQWREHTHG
ncbi:MBL fold metallo-hydrolase [Pseudoxanthomonas sp. JBR18]|uniref:MBL fold metallo-hydrolase n=1 Tax=Pseudoxanthomonas sp. JBR18 TaxID=2969308 RepID=UPI00230573B8|nr:MBL fold metallo-hydrolase [Pseudoxanthomonas sp. JBR18]WCE05689.1 MBL fold metallo-hydrolase [Pseudoxanthomonas sp. JBR18]